jgi:UDP-N-acetyl-D-glucosamine dehydrogenase
MLAVVFYQAISPFVRFLTGVWEDVTAESSPRLGVEEDEMDTFDVTVTGLGFVGLPTAVIAARAGLRVLGVDRSAQRVDEIVNLAPGCGLTTVTEAELGGLLETGAFQVCTTAGQIPPSRTHVVCVPTSPGFDYGADIGPLLDSIDAVASRLRRGDLVVVQSTCPPGTVERVLLPRLTSGSGLAPGSGFFLAYAPVRIDPSNDSFDLSDMPRVVGGVTSACRAAAERFLRQFTRDVVPVRSTHTAELVKVFENTFRLVNISLVNELATLCRASRVDFDEVLDAAGTKPYGFVRLQPSAGAGGDCIPVSAGFFAAAARSHGVAATVVETAITLNQAMPAATVHHIRQVLAANGLGELRGRRVLVVGVTYKPDVPNVRQSAAVRVLEQLRLEADVRYHDPHVPTLVLSDGTTLRSAALDDDADIVLVLTRHRVVDEGVLLRSGLPVVDCSGGAPMLLRWRGLSEAARSARDGG